MSDKKRQRGKRIHIEVDEELARVIDETCKLFRLKQPDFIRWTLARHLLGTESLSAIALENAR